MKGDPHGERTWLLALNCVLKIRDWLVNVTIVKIT